MATPPPVPPNDGETPDRSVSWFHKTVTLRDWWLVKSDAEAQGKRLAVAGFRFSENKARRFFRSAPIAKSFDEFALETEDRIVVVLQGLINEARTIENGFSSEIIDRFLFGFPSCWEEHTNDCFGKVVDPGLAANHDRDAVGLNESTTDLVEVASNGNMCIPEQMSNSKEDTMTVDTTKSGFEVDASCTSNMKGGNFVSSDPNCGKRECAKDLKDGKVQKFRLRSPPAGKSNPMKQNAPKGTSAVAGLAASAHEKVTRKVVTRSVSRNLKDGKTQHLSSKVQMNQEDKKSLSEPKKRPSHGKLKRDTGTSQSSPAEVNGVGAMLRAGRKLRRSSTHSKRGQANNKGSSAKKKAKRRVEFDVDVDVTPKKHMTEKKTCIHSTDSSTFKRSRSGRLLLPTLQFWRNQIPVYDAERNLTGIQDEVDA